MPSFPKYLHNLPSTYPGMTSLGTAYDCADMYTNFCIFLYFDASLARLAFISPLIFIILSLLPNPPTHDITASTCGSSDCCQPTLLSDTPMSPLFQFTCRCHP